ncbi:MAG TPA: hypothetical protein VFJ82_11110 [Longimicrobium sp.]|nr:hypothetical protein [Longimicrobium sp.]
MRRAAALSLVLASLAACADQATLPGPPPPDAVRAAVTSTAGGGEVIVSQPQTVAWNVGGWEAGNEPMAEAGGGRVVWQDASGPMMAQPLVVRAYDFGSGARSQVVRVYGDYTDAHTAGRYVVWSENGVIHLRDQATGTAWTVGPGWEPRVSADGKVAFITFERPNGRDPQNRNVAVYDVATHATRVLTRYTDAGGAEAHYPAIDGNIVAWTVVGVWPASGSWVRMMNLATGEVRELDHMDSQFLTRSSVSAGRIAWVELLADRRSAVVMLYDVATGTKRRITTSAAQPIYDARISGSLVVWEDRRNTTSTRYYNENDVYAYDLSTGREVAVATGPNHQGWPSVDGSRVVWTELANGRWEIRAATVQAVSLESLGRTVDGMLVSGEIRNRGTAQALRAFLTQATRARRAGDVAGERSALQRFAQHVRSQAGKQITNAAAARLAGMADALLRTLGG